MFEEELTKQGLKMTNGGSSLGEDGKNVKPVADQIKDENDETGAALASGVMGKQPGEVVFILEGDSESATTPEVRIENIAVQPEMNQVVNPESENKYNPEINNKPETLGAAGAANTEANKPVAVNTEATLDNSANATGEVMARMPEIKTHDRQENTENNSKNSENGNLSPLENENDKSTVKGQNERTFQNAADAVRSAIEDKAEPIAINEIAPPLSEGIKPEQFQATQQMTQAALSAPVKTENLFSEMISRVETMQNDSKSTMTIQLNPEYLGRVALEVAVDAAGLHVRINAEDSGVRNMINGQLAALIESLENKGIAVVEVEVAYTGINYGAFQDPREGGQQQQNKHQPTNRETTPTDGIAYYASLPDLMEYYLDAGVSSVEYRA